MYLEVVHLCILDKLMSQTVAHAADNWADGNPPIAAMIIRNGQVIEIGANRVLAESDPTAHAEIVVIRKLCKRLGVRHLPGHELICTLEPCPMCLAACYWAQIDRIWFGMTSSEAAEAGLPDSKIFEDMQRPSESRLIPCQRIEIRGYNSIMHKYARSMPDIASS